MIAVGLFVAALVTVGILLLTSPNDEGDSPGVAGSTSTPTTSQSILDPTAGQPTPTSGAVSSATSPSATGTRSQPTSTSTDSGASPTPSVNGDEPSPSPTEELVEDEPTEEPEPDATATAEPTTEPDMGDFGTLPPAQIVSGGLARNVDLDYELAISLDAVPVSATAYRLYWAGWSADDAASVASKVGIVADVEGASGSYEVVGDGGQLYISRTVVQYVNTRQPVGGLLEDNATVIENARIWLANSGITAGNVGEGALIGRDDAAQRAVILFKPTSPAPLLAFYPSATVTIGPGGDVREANIRWPDGYDTSEYGMRPASQIWNDVLAGEGSIDADLSELPGSGPVSGTLTVYDVSIAYSFAVAGDGSEYLVPLIVFTGEIYAPEYGESVPAAVYIQGVYGQSAPRG
jgi:hypothetical protein